MWVRFTNDVFCLFRGKEELARFKEWINGLYPSIKFDFSQYSNSISLLNTEVFRDLFGKLAARNFQGKK